MVASYPGSISTVNSRIPGMNLGFRVLGFLGLGFRV